MATIGVDVGGTNITVARVHGGEASHHAKASTPTDGPEALIRTIVALVEGVVDDHDLDLDRVGLGVPGTVDPVHGVLRTAPNLGIGDEPVAVAALVGTGLADAGLGDVEVRVDNDVNVAARGEWRHGAAVGHDDVLAVWWGTGIGGGLVLDGRVRTGTSGSAGEIGHTLYAADGRRCRCGHDGHVEAYAGRAALEAEARRRHAAGEPTRLVDLAGDDRMKSRIWAEALDDGDVTAASLLDQAAHALGVGIASAVTLIDVDLVVIGGGLGSRLGTPWAERIGRVARQAVFGQASFEVVTSALGDDAGVIGAAALFE